MPLQGIGRIVHFVAEGRCRPGQVTALHGDPAANPIVNLMVTMDDVNTPPHLFVASVEYAAVPNPGSSAAAKGYPDGRWHWPEPAHPDYAPVLVDASADENGTVSDYAAPPTVPYLR